MKKNKNSIQIEMEIVHEAMNRIADKVWDNNVGDVFYLFKISDIISIFEARLKEQKEFLKMAEEDGNKEDIKDHKIRLKQHKDVIDALKVLQDYYGK